MIGRVLLTNKLAQVGELFAVFVPALVVILGTIPLVGANPLARGSVILLANLLMLFMVWLGLRLRAQDWEHFGLSFRFAGGRPIMRTVLQSIVVFAAALAAFMVGAVVMANIVGMPDGADMSGYNYLRGNVPMLIVSLAAVYVGAAFAEEVIYRAFLINRLAELGSGTKAAWRWAVVISSLVFGVIHSDWGLVGMVQTTFMGLALGVSYLVVGRNLWVTILAHGYMVTILIVQMYLS